MKHRIYATRDHRWRWWVYCAYCGDAAEMWDDWNTAVWYLRLHLKVTHDAT